MGESKEDGQCFGGEVVNEKMGREGKGGGGGDFVFEELGKGEG